MARLLIVRHGETDLAGTFCGHSDPPLNQAGRAQVDTLLQRLAAERFDAVYCSDLERARQTATPFALARDIPLKELAAFREISFGEWEGLRWREIEARDETFARRWAEEFPNLAAPGGECFRDLRSRVLQTFDRLLTQDPEGSVLLVTHAGVMRVILTERCGVSEEEAWVRTRDYCCWFRYPDSKEVIS